MRTRKILFPTDFSMLSDAALDYAASLAAESNGSLLIVHVEEPPAVYGGGEMYYGMLDTDNAALEKMLANVVPSNASVPCEHRLLTGNPAAEIVRLAHDEHVDLIVMTTHGRSGLLHLLMGSVAEAVVRKAECPVLTLKPCCLETAKTG